MGLRRFLRPRVMVAVVAAVALLAAGIGLAVALSQPAPLTIRNVRIPVVDGPRDNQHVIIDASFFTPPGGGRLPAVLLAHGFGETKDAVRPQAEELARTRSGRRIRPAPAPRPGRGRRPWSPRIRGPAGRRAADRCPAA